MSLGRSKTHWEDMGRLDPCWAILSDPSTKHGKWELEEFFATGKDEVLALLRTAKSFGLPKEYSWALDFGCGLGRLTRSLADHFRNIVGIDISEAMVRQAVRLDAHARCHFLVYGSDILPFRSRQFDLIYTVIVLQHVPTRASIRRYIAEFVRVLKPGGLLVMQLPHHIPLVHRLQVRPRLYSWLRTMGLSEKSLYRKMHLHPISMRFLPEKEVVSIIESGGGTVLKVYQDQRAGPHISSRTYYATKSS